MTNPERLQDKDMANVIVALRRAAKRARKIAQQTGTAIVTMQNGKMIKEYPSPDEAIDID